MTENDSKMSYSLRRSINKFNELHFIYLLRQLNWLHVYGIHDLNFKVNCFISVFLEVVDVAFPLVFTKSNSNQRNNNNKKWYTSELHNLKQKCLFRYSMYVHHGISEFRCKYNEVKKVYKSR